jgi:hypothetical protein
MPKELEDKLKQKAKQLHLGKERTGAYVYGTLRKTGWKPDREQAHEAMVLEFVDILLERDDISKLPLSHGAKVYARRTSKSLGKQPQQWMDVQRDILNKGLPRHSGFPSMDKSQKAGSAIKY